MLLLSAFYRFTPKQHGSKSTLNHRASLEGTWALVLGGDLSKAAAGTAVTPAPQVLEGVQLWIGSPKLRVEQGLGTHWAGMGPWCQFASGYQQPPCGQAPG